MSLPITAKDSPERIWLSPQCDEDSRTWGPRTWGTRNPFDACPECGAPSVEYVRADLAAPAAPEQNHIPDAGKMVPTHRHKKRGTEYVLVGIGKMQSSKWIDPIPPHGLGHPRVDNVEVVIYRSVDDGSLWARPREEFDDGRFEEITP